MVLVLCDCTGQPRICRPRRTSGSRCAHDSGIATYSSRDQNRYFEWADIYPYATPNDLAMHFVERFPEVAEAGEGSDWPYAGWYWNVAPKSPGPVSLRCGQTQGAGYLFADGVSRKAPTEVADCAATAR